MVPSQKRQDEYQNHLFVLVIITKDLVPPKMMFYAPSRKVVGSISFGAIGLF
jgi:hypothetical protein